MVSNDFATFIRILKNYNLIPYDVIKEYMFNERLCVKKEYQNTEAVLKHQLKRNRIQEFLIILYRITRDMHCHGDLFWDIKELLECHYWNDRYHWSAFQNDLEELLFKNDMLTDEMLNLKL